jgi:ribosome-binding ATPase YchF (GTP1/OBG family)
LLTMKPVIFAANVAESDLADSSANPHVQKVIQRAAILETEAVVVSAQVEAELTELDAAEREEYLKSLGVSEGGLGSLVRSTYNLLGLRTYFTSGVKVLLVHDLNCSRHNKHPHMLHNGSYICVCKYLLPTGNPSMDNFVWNDSTTGCWDDSHRL